VVGSPCSRWWGRHVWRFVFPQLPRVVAFQYNASSSNVHNNLQQQELNMKTTINVLLIAILGLSHVLAADAVTPEQKLAKLGLTLKPVTALGNYVPAVRTGNLVFLSGQIPRGADGQVLAGKVGRNATVAQATEAAQASTVQLLSALKAEVGDLQEPVKQLSKALGMTVIEEA
jgi:enamine deaminase RidA (YjgF/YER057c/UK114 family)